MSQKKPVPTMPWSAPHFWSFRPISLIVLCFGFILCGTGESLLFRSALGNSPWTLLADGIAKQTHLDVAFVSLLISVFILALWRIWHIKIGLGTLINTFLTAIAFYFANLIIPSMEEAHVIVRIIMCFIGVTIIGLGSALYISCYLGTGPRDGLMVAISGRYNKSLAFVRTALELFACISGYLLGGTFGLGTAIFAFLVGPTLGFFVSMLKQQRLFALKKQHHHNHKH